MMQLWVFLALMIGMFAAIGFMRGYAKELVATAGLVLALFTLKQFELLLIDPLAGGKQASKFYLQATILLAMAFFAYQTPTKTFANVQERKSFQDGVLGLLVGAFNGYLLFGSLWWYMDTLEYPFSPNIIAPLDPASTSAKMVDMLPLTWMLSGDGSVLSVIMIGFFIYIIVVVV